MAERHMLATERLAYDLCGDRVGNPEALAEAFQMAWIEHRLAQLDPEAAGDTKEKDGGE